MQVLVVDDEPGVRRLVCRMLAQGGYGTCEAADGAEALASLRAGLAVDLVLSDVAMPQLNGVSCSRRSPCPIPTYLYSPISPR